MICKKMALSFCGKRILLSRTSYLQSLRYQQGYIVLIPEIGEDLPDKNPLVEHEGLPEFNNITIEKCTATIAKQTLQFETGVKDIETALESKEKDSINVFKDVIEPLEELGAPLELTWGLSKTLYLGNNSLMPTKNYLAIHERAKRARATKFNSGTIYNVVKSELEKKSERTKEEKRVLRKFALEGKLNGLELDEGKRRHLQENFNKITAEKQKFRQKIDKLTNKFVHHIEDSSVVRDFPESLLKTIAHDPKNYLAGPWKVTLQPNVYLPVMQYCPDREIRWNLWQALVSRGSGYSDRQSGTGVHLEEIRFQRRDIAKLLGFESYAQMSMETKMAGSVTNVETTLSDLSSTAKPAQDLEIENLHQFALERGFKYDKLELWDVPYWRLKQQKTLFDYNEEKYKDSFPLTKVLEGLFALSEKLFNVTIRQRNGASAWHKDVKFYDIFEADCSSPVAGFYLDPYARSEDKLRHPNVAGWMVGIQNQSKITNLNPLAALIFNFDSPTSVRPSHLSFKEVKTLFHKFGHALQHLLTKTTYSEVSGLSNIEWDAVEVSGFVLSHWLNNKSVINSISTDSIEESDFNNLVNSQKHLAAYDLSRELYLSALDLELHNSSDFWLDIVKKLWPQYRSFRLDKLDSHPCSFTQIFIEEWAAAYYSQLWSKMIAADVYSAFHEVQNDEKEVLKVGNRFRNTFLALGGSVHPNQIFREFRGRDPSPTALLKSLGLKGTNVEP